MLHSLKKINNKEQFIPTYLSLLINANYFIKKGIYKGVKKYAHYMHGTMMDFGCGNKPYKNLMKVNRYVGIDIENSAHDHSTEEIDILYNGYQIPFNNEYFDSVFSAEVFEHVFHLEEIIKEINRVMKLNGIILITVPFVWHEHEIPNDFARYSSYGMKDLLERNNFKILHQEKSTTYIETLVQMWNAFLFNIIFPNNIYLKIFLTIIFIAPFNLWGLFLSKLF